MNKGKYFLVLDAGTSGVKALIFTNSLEVVGRAHKSIQKFFPHKYFVEQNPKEIVEASVDVIKKVVKENKIDPSDIVAMGITNQRETTILWNKKTGEPIYNAIVWEDERTSEICKELQKNNEIIRSKTGLTILPYFSASKIFWILKNVPMAKKLLLNKTLLFGTVDTWLLWNISKNKNHATDYTNASRTLLFNCKNLSWDKQLLDIFSVPGEILPKVFPSQSVFGTLQKNILGKELPIVALCGDQQSSMYAAGVGIGETKITYGTGTFIMQSLGEKFILRDGFFTTLIPSGKRYGYALEAKVNATGRNVEENLADKKKLQQILISIAKEAAKAVRKLPIVPLKITADGGITRNTFILEKQEELLKIPIKKHSIFDGTAYGTAKLVKDFQSLR